MSDDIFSCKITINGRGMVKENLAFYAKRLFKVTAAKLGTSNFHIAGGALRSFVEDFSGAASEAETLLHSNSLKDIDCFFF